MIVDEGPIAKKSKPAPRMDFLLAGSWRNTTRENADTTKDSVNEFVWYLQTAQADNGTDPLQWWRENAFHSFAIPGMSVLSERVFSMAANILNHKQSCLLPDKVNMLIFFIKNHKL